MHRLLFALVAVSVACLGAAAPSGRDALRHIAQDLCAPHWLEAHDPSPCLRVAMAEPPPGRDGYVILADRKGGAHLLLIPIAAVSGMESAELRRAGAPNYFAPAWTARDLLAARAERTLRRGDIGLALNPRHARTQDQFHIHIECLRPRVAAQLRDAAPRITAAWSTALVDSFPYLAVRVMGEDLAGANPIALLDARLPHAGAGIGDYTLIVAGMSFAQGPGFVLLAANGPAGELLLDSTCAVAGLK